MSNRRVEQCQKIEESLLENNEKINSILETSSVGFYQSSIQGRLLSANKAFLEILDFDSLEEAKSKSIISLYKNPEEREYRFLKPLREKGKVEIEEDIITAKDRDKTILVRAVINKKKELISGLIFDITELKKTETKYRELFENANDIIFTFDLLGNFKSVNRSCYSALGYTEEEFLKKNLKDILTPDGYRFATEMIQKAILEKSDLKELQPWEFEVVKKDSSNLIVEIYAQLIWEKKQIVGIHGIARDITERKRTDKKITLSRNFLEIANRSQTLILLLKEFVSEIKRFTGCAAVGIRILDEEGNIPYQAYEGFSHSFYEKENSLSIKYDQCTCINVIKGITDPKLPFYTPTGSFYTNCSTDFLATISEEKRGKNRYACNREGYESIILIPIRLGEKNLGLIHIADYKKNMISLDTVEILESSGNYLSTAMQRLFTEEMLRNFEIKQLEKLEELVKQRTEELEMVNKELDEFTSLAAHDLKEPLRNTQIFARFLMEDYSSKLDNTGKDYLKRIVVDGERFVKLIDDLLALSKISRVKNPYTWIDFRELIGNAINRLESVIKEKKVEITLPEKFPSIFCDAIKIKEVFYNLISNAIKYNNKEKPKINIEVEENQKDIKFSVKDNGIGIKKEHFEVIFQPFKRLHQKDEHLGTGIGMTIVKRIIEEHSGQIWVESEEENGTTFFFTFPKKEKQ